MTRIFTNVTDPDLQAMIRAGAVGVIPTDTVYGLAAAADDPKAVTKLYALKHREQKPGTTIAASTEQLINLGLDAQVIAQVAQFWPAPLSIIISQGEQLQYLHQGIGSSPFRVVADKQVQQLLEHTGPLVTSSANQPGEAPATNLAEAQAYFGDGVDYYVDGGDLSDRQSSTIARLDDDGRLHILRQGAATIFQEDN